jgi:transcriptional repressor NrdR
MRCPFCATGETRVVDSRPADGGQAIRRRRECAACGKRFTTYERSELAVMVRKRDGSHETFDPLKVRRGVESALADRPVPDGSVDALLGRVEALVYSDPDRVTTEMIGRLVLDGLREIDEVAYLRFASVYKDFRGAADFGREVAALETDE